MKRTVVVTGATGRQGGVVARHLLQQGWHVRGVTRHPAGPAARLLARLGVELIEGDLNSRASLDRALQGAYGVFGVTDFWEHGFEAEVRQGKTLVDAAVDARVQHFVFNSVGGVDRTEGLAIAHFDSKRAIEAHLRRGGLAATVFRPVTFLENFVSRRIRKAVCVDGVFRFCIRPSTPFQMVAMHDVGAFVAKAFAEPGVYADRAMEIASVRVTMLEFVAALASALGRPVRYECLGPALQWVIAAYVQVTGTSGRYKVGPSLIAQFRWNNASPAGGWDADIEALRRLHPGLMTIREWMASVNWRAGL